MWNVNSIQARLWLCGCGDVSTPSFGTHLTLSQPGGGQIMPTLYWCPHQVLRVTGAPASGSGFTIAWYLDKPTNGSIKGN